MNTNIHTASAVGNSPWERRLAVLLPFVAVGVAFAPALGAGFMADDWAILALARHGGSGWDYFFTDHTATYSYRPNGMLVWHLVIQLFGWTALPQYAVQFLLHGSNAALLALLLLRLGATPWRAALLGLVYALHPIASGTVLWLADRFDLIAVNGTLLLLLSLDAWRCGRRGALLLVLLSAAWAAGAKEVALAVLPAALAWVWLAGKGRPRGERVAVALAATLPFAAALAMRWLIFGSSGVDRTGSALTLSQSVLTGGSAWIHSLPMALIGSNPGMLITLLAGVLLLVVLVLSAWNASQPAAMTEHRLALVAGLALVVFPALLQSPVTAVMLVSPDPLGLSSNMRFFYLALAGLIIGSVPIRWTSAGLRWIPASIMLVVVVLLALPAWNAAVAWRRVSVTPIKQQLATAIGEAIRASRYQPGCMLYIEDIPEDEQDVSLYADSIAKAQLPPGDPRFDCLVVSSSLTLLALTSPRVSRLPAGVAARPVAGIPERVRGLKLASRAIMNGRIQVHFPDRLSAHEARQLGGVHLLRWDGSALVEDAR
ncbi:MAG: hypothetical protein KDI75_02785 [Xanthomonadales bacterium]|nr:hypothetical protein [Xanthomonadales bacterium]